MVDLIISLLEDCLSEVVIALKETVESRSLCRALSVVNAAKTTLTVVTYHTLTISSTELIENLSVDLVKFIQSGFHDLSQGDLFALLLRLIHELLHSHRFRGSASIFRLF